MIRLKVALVVLVLLPTITSPAVAQITTAERADVRTSTSGLSPLTVIVSAAVPTLRVSVRAALLGNGDARQDAASFVFNRS